MEEDIRAKIIKNNKIINELLLENEKLIKSSGHNPPTDNFVLNVSERIEVPSGYIRTSNLFNNRYYLDLIVKENKLKKNITYSLQFSDFHNFILNRFNIWGSVGTILYKHDFINLISIIESLILESASNISNQCKIRNCKNIARCEKHISKIEKNYFKEAIDKLCSLHVLNYNQVQTNRLKELIDYRNRIHIRLADDNEFLDDKFNLSIHNEAIKILIDLVETLKNNAVPYYSKCIVETQEPAI